MRLLITNSVPLNGGDEALLRALIQTLARSSPEAEFTVLTSATGQAREFLPDLRFDDDLEHATPESARPFLARLRGLRSSRVRLLGARVTRATLDLAAGGQARRRIRDLYAATDAVFSAPGGYLHDHYPVAQRLAGLELALELGKPVLLIGHSIGPFWKPGSIRRARAVLDRVSSIVVREPYSLDHLRACGVREDHVSLAADLAFALADAAPGSKYASEPVRGRVAVCFRRWPLHDAASAVEVRGKAVSLCRHLLRPPDRELVFVSTCQGVPGYVDDSLFADEIFVALPDALRARCFVDRRHRGPTELMGFLHECDAVVSMRMHVCILAMLAGTPAMALDYEQKSVGTYEMMGLDAYHADFRESAQVWLARAERLLGDVDALRGSLDVRVARMTRSATDAVAGAARLLGGGTR